MTAVGAAHTVNSNSFELRESRIPTVRTHAMPAEAARDRPALLGAAHLDLGEYSDDVRNHSLIERRMQHVANSVLFFHDPIKLVRGEGVWLYDDADRPYLDCYNNVASVGHCHPDVVSALTEQAGRLNTHTRYLHEGVVEYAEKLTSLMPDGLDVCTFVCTGTEANDLALRIARTVTGNDGVVVMEGGYHGNSSTVDALSLLIHPASDDRPDWVEAVEPPNTYRGSYRRDRDDELGARYADLVAEATERLDARSHGTAAFLCDTIFDSHGGLAAPTDYFARAYEHVRAAGGLCIADEVQAGLARTGRWWGFEHYGVVPDIVTLGKPMGDGHPIGIVITSREIAQKFAANAFYFNTFGGNPVSAAVGRTVLDICERNDLPQRCQDTGALLLTRLGELQQRHPIIGDVRGLGTFIGVELVRDNESLTPATELARQIPDAMKDRGVLIGLSGRYGNVLKIRPPLVFGPDEIDLLVETLDAVLADLPAEA
ncbi:aminotransferase class III-fold pyridoxal phosphate-dependent enzyme [Gordonia sp. SL306]|uniref:aminotransferase class III-fold pyridoxal phosphate-dependent enzyme n=1 Tax=Gordonia sp. SL306 TaxID=2995145 RepID=UPI00226E5B36|nr:aminotransferase class III-fold pyridoxal phosphate-dependent enzyme [Gordonia sp. SL306]WAC57733.1 aminotransferase class III-fold pyridoxal phosphate-dependent enzyme [Gordonia sp. SL306]